MSKLEKKLIKLGYEIKESVVKDRKFCFKKIEDSFITIYTNKKITKVISEESYINCIDNIFYLKDYEKRLNNLQQAYNQLQKDLEELKECQD